MLKQPSERGRRAGTPDTRAAIRDAARARFLRQGYRSVTLREIASDAGVDVALIAYYFGSKQGLFGDAMSLPINPAQVVASVLDGDPATLAERLLRTLVSIWDSADVGAQLQAVAFTALADSNMLSLISDGIAREIVNRIADYLGGPDATRRAAAFTTQTTGLISRATYSSWSQWHRWTLTKLSTYWPLRFNSRSIPTAAVQKAAERSDVNRARDRTSDKERG